MARPEKPPPMMITGICGSSVDDIVGNGNVGATGRLGDNYQRQSVQTLYIATRLKFGCQGRRTVFTRDPEPEEGHGKHGRGARGPRRVDHFES